MNVTLVLLKLNNKFWPMVTKENRDIEVTPLVFHADLRQKIADKYPYSLLELLIERINGMCEGYSSQSREENST